MTSPKKSGASVSLQTGAKQKPLSAAQKREQLEHAAMIAAGAKQVAEGAWRKGSGEVGLSAHLRDTLNLPVIDVISVLTGAFDRLAELAAVEPLEAGADAKARAAHAVAEKEAGDAWFKAGNSVATLARSLRKAMDLDRRPVVSIKLDKANLKATVTVLPAGVSLETVQKALQHDKKALAQVEKVLAKEEEERAEIAAAAKGLPSPKAEREALEKAEQERLEAAGLINTTTGKPLSDSSPLAIAASLAVWPSEQLTTLATLLTGQAERNAKAEQKAAEKAEKEADLQARREAASKAGKGAGANAKPSGKPGAKRPAKGEKPAPVGADTGRQVAPATGNGALKDVSKPSAADTLAPAAVGLKVTPTNATPATGASA